MYHIIRTDLPGADLSLKVEREVLGERKDVVLEGAICSDDDEVIRAAQDADVILTNDCFITRHVLENLPKLRAVVRYGIGYDRVDVPAATDNGVAVVNIPGFCVTELAQHVIMGILAWNTQLTRLNAAVKEGKWLEARASVGPAMGPTEGQVLGILGFGNSGRKTAQLALALGMKVIACSEHLTQNDLAMGVRHVSRDEMLAGCDFLSISCDLNDRTRHSVGEHEFSRMKPSAVLINTARGAVIDEPALIRALQTGRIAGAYLDVLEQEPPTEENPLLKMENVMFTPHEANYSSRSIRVRDESVMQEALRCVTDGQRPLHIVNEAELKEKGSRLQIE